MKLRALAYLAILLAALLCIPVVGAEAAPDFDKIVQIHLDYQGNAYSVSSIDVTYGKAPNLNIRSGELTGVILGSGGKEIKTFSLRQPGTAYGDILGSEGGESLIGYSESASAGSLIITIPYLQDMQKFSLVNAKDGSVLVSADLNEPVSSFCSEYSQDPECLVRIAAAPVAAPDNKAVLPDKATYLALATVFSASVFLAAGIAIWTLRRRAASATPRKQTVLIVDDEPDIVNIIHLALEKKGFATLQASNGKECLEVLKKQVPDIILLDVMMEPMDGWETLEQIKSTAAYQSVPVLMLTGKKPTPEEANKYRVMFHDYIMKPFRIDDLYAAIDAINDHNQKLNKSLVLAKQAGIDKDKVFELSRLTLRIAVNKKIIDILDLPQAIPVQADLDTLDDMLVADYINVKTRSNEKRVEELKHELSTAFRSKGISEFNW